MKFGSIFVNHPSNASFNPNSRDITGSMQNGVNTHDLKRGSATLFDPPPVDAFSNACRAAQHALSGYLMLCSAINRAQCDAVSEGRTFFLQQLEGIAESHCPTTPRLDPEASDEPFLPKFLREMGYRFFDQISACIDRIRDTPPWLSNSAGTVFLNPELVGHIKHHLAGLRTIDAIVTPFRSEGQVNTMAPAVHNKRAKVLRHVFANAHTQTIPADQSHISTQTSVAPQKGTQTAAPVPTVVASSAAQTMDVDCLVDAMQTEITSEFFSRDAAIQTKQCVDKAVAANLSVIDAETQTDSDIDKGWDALQDMVKKIVADVMDYTSGRPVPACWQEPDAVPRDLDMQFMLMFDVFNNRCGKVKSSNDKDDLLRTVAEYFLPCMEHTKTARMQLSASYVVKQFSEQEQGMKAAIEDTIRILGNALELGTNCIEWLQKFAWEDNQESRAALRGIQAFTSSGAPLIYFKEGSSPASNPGRSFDLNMIVSAVNDIASTLPQISKNKST